VDEPGNQRGVSNRDPAVEREDEEVGGSKDLGDLRGRAVFPPDEGVGDIQAVGKVLEAATIASILGTCVADDRQAGVWLSASDLPQSGE
jgi:hypothetical protein